MQFTWDELISRARTFVDDDHDDDKGWLTPATWMKLAQVEYGQLYRRWVKTSLIAPEPLDTPLFATDAPGVDVPIPGVLAILGVAEVTGETGNRFYRVLRPGLTTAGKQFRSDVANYAEYWEAYGIGDIITVRLTPPDISRSYVVRYIDRPEYVTDTTTTVELPYGTDERLVLGMARRAHLKDSVNSALLNGLIMEADAEMNMAAFAKMGMSGRQVEPRRSTPRNDFSYNPATWRWF